jgi:hypothetical protein
VKVASISHPNSFLRRWILLGDSEYYHLNSKISVLDEDLLFLYQDPVPASPKLSDPTVENQLPGDLTFADFTGQNSDIEKAYYRSLEIISRFKSRVAFSRRKTFVISTDIHSLTIPLGLRISRGIILMSD